jgi:hypothetical protein
MRTGRGATPEWGEVRARRVAQGARGNGVMRTWRYRARAGRAATLALVAAGGLCAAVALRLPLAAQVAESANDPTGVSIPYPLVHLVHSSDDGKVGATGWFGRRDPFLLYQLGRDLLNRSFQLKHGAYGRPAELSVPLYREDPEGPQNGPLARIARDHTSSCGFCHSSPYREPGGGQTIGSTSAPGRNSPHFFGAGLVEMLGEQIRRQVLERYDANHNGVIDRAEVAGPRPVLIAPEPGAPPIDFGDLAPGPDGVPRLNPLFRVWYLDARGRVLADAYGLDDPRVAAFNFAVEPFGWGRGWHQIGTHRVSEGGEAATIRGFYTSAADVHMGLQAHDPTQQERGNGLGARSLAGAQQYAALGGAPDHGRKLSRGGVSLDDPDGDGHPSELTEGDVDAVEFYMLHAPAPAVRATARSEQGRRVLQAAGCVRCHVESWRIEARDLARGSPGDRRLFALETASRPAGDGTVEVVGRLVPLYRRAPEGGYEPLGGAARVERIYTDFKHWDIGPRFYERRFDGTLQREHRTAPLWGAGSTAPYGHAGQFMTLDAVIAAHDGAAAPEAAAYRRLPSEQRRQLIEYLESLVLYSTDTVRSDIDGDGRIAEHFTVAGVDVGYERFDARFLFAHPPRFERLLEVSDPYGRKKPLLRIGNVAEAYGLDLPYRRSTHDNGFPDAVDLTPAETQDGKAGKGGQGGKGAQGGKSGQAGPPGEGIR